MVRINWVLAGVVATLEATCAVDAAETTTQPYTLPECPSTAGYGAVRILSGNPSAGLYLSAAVTGNNVILTTQSINDAMHVRLTPGINPTPIQILNPTNDGYSFLGLATNRAAAAFGPNSGSDYTALTYISDPNANQVTSPYQGGKTTSKGLWTIGINGELLFDWDHTDGSVYKMTHSVVMDPPRVAGTSNLDAYINFRFQNNASGHAEVTLVYEPISD
ncbi:hypothetical protein AURDEDRAFT_114824 [Auricularia subglabra TFB-10046 SS5]|nr:hypothetical protein AURDEDRAFT_114824 [Auricularia subglabra TFB-10046 SS5]